MHLYGIRVFEQQKTAARQKRNGRQQRLKRD